jgi:hypothetical protein
MRKNLAVTIEEFTALGGAVPLPTVDERLDENYRPVSRSRIARLPRPRPTKAKFWESGPGEPATSVVVSRMGKPAAKALDEVRRLSTREAWCYRHVQAIQVAIDQYAEAALGNREFFLNKPHSIGGSRKAGDVP